MEVYVIEENDFFDFFTNDIESDDTYSLDFHPDAYDYGNMEGFYSQKEICCPNCGFNYTIQNMKMFGICPNCGIFSNKRDDFIYKP